MHGTELVERRLRLAFAAGAIADAVAILPMISPPVAKLGFGVVQSPFNSIVATGCSVSLMLGWTLLLVWAYRQPIERRFVAALTLVVIGDLVLTEALAVSAGDVSMIRMAPMWLLQGAITNLFLCALRSSQIEK